MSAGATGGVLAILFKSPWPLLIPVLASLGRQYFFCHYFLDTLAGGSVGLMAAWLVDRVIFAPGGFASIENWHIAVFAPIFAVMMKLSTVFAKAIRKGLKLDTDAAGNDGGGSRGTGKDPAKTQ